MLAFAAANPDAALAAAREVRHREPVVTAQLLAHVALARAAEQPGAASSMLDEAEALIEVTLRDDPGAWASSTAKIARIIAVSFADRATRLFREAESMAAEHELGLRYSVLLEEALSAPLRGLELLTRLELRDRVLVLHNAGRHEEATSALISLLGERNWWDHVDLIGVVDPDAMVALGQAICDLQAARPLRPASTFTWDD